MNWIGFRLWIYTVLLNGLFFGIGSAFNGGVKYFFLIVVVAASVGLFITAPLLFVIPPLVKISGKLPYHINARIIWLAIMLVLTDVSFIVLLEAMLSGKFFGIDEELSKGLIASVTLANLSAIWLERNSLIRKYSA